jgi:ribosomal protein S18 acetylase RimI-like enzyme
MSDIRSASTADIPSIQSIARRTWADTYRGTIEPDAQAAVLDRAYSKESLEASIGRGQAFLVAEVRDPSPSIAGFVDMDFDGRQVNLHRLYVLPEHQRLGLGRRLLEAAIDRIRGGLSRDVVVPLVAHVERDNPKARAFYRKAGFTEGEEEIVVIGGISLPVIRISMTIKGD